METENHTSLERVHLNIMADHSNKHVGTNHPEKFRALYLFKIATRILTSKHPKLFSIYFL